MNEALYLTAQAAAVNEPILLTTAQASWLICAGVCAVVMLLLKITEPPE